MTDKAAVNINDTFFKGFYKEVWRRMIPPGLTEAEADFIEDVCQLTPGMQVLDLMCGYGRHSLALGRKGYKVTAIDNLPDYIAEINERAAAEGLPVLGRQQNVATAAFGSGYDAAICMGNSFAFFNYEEAQTILLNLAAALNTGAKFIINTWMIAEIAIRHFQEKAWHYVDEYKYLMDNKYLLRPSRIETDHIIIAPNGEVETLKGVDYIFSIAELEDLLNKTGFQLNEIYYTPRKRKFTLGDNKAYIVAEKL